MKFLYFIEALTVSLQSKKITSVKKINKDLITSKRGVTAEREA